MSDSQSSYRQIMKATSIFGGVQVFNILIAIIRSKAVAVLLGPGGMGINALLSSTLSLVGGLTNFGLGTAAVKNIAAAHASGEKVKLAKTIKIFRKLVWITGGLGFIATLFLAPVLSDFAFNNTQYTVSFMVLAITLLFGQISAGQSALLQGMRRIQEMAKAGIVGSVFGLITSLPLYYWFKEEGIVPALVLTSITSLALSWYFARKIQLPKVLVSKTEITNESRDMLKMGFLISFSGLITMGTSYVVRIFISNTGGLTDVGLFSAGFTIINTYVGMVFAAMSTDYYPRLSSVANETSKTNEVINQQAEIALLILAPILIVFLVYIQWMVVLLYSKDFLGIINMIHWAALGIFFKAVSWSIGFLILAKGDSRIFFWNELLANAYMLVFNILGYYWGGLTGLGISFLASYFVYLLQIFVIAQWKYKFRIHHDLKTIFALQLFLGIGCFIIVHYFEGVSAYALGSVCIFISLYFSWKGLDKRIGLSQMIKNRFKR